MSTIEPQPLHSVARSTFVHALAAAALYFSPVTVVLAPLTLFVPAAFLHAALKNGLRSAWGAIIGSGAIILVLGGGLSLLGSSTDSAAAIAAGVRFLLEVAVPAGLMAVLLLRGHSFGSLLTAGLAASGAGILAGELVMRGLFHYSPYAALVTNFRTMSAETLRYYKSIQMPADALKMMTTAADIMVSSFMPFVLLSVAALTFLLSLTLLPRLPAARTTGSRFLFRNFALPEWMLILFVLGGISPLARGPLRMAGLNVLAVVALLYFFQGLAVFRAIILRLGFGAGGRFLAWGMLALLMFYGLAPIALFIVGLFDPFFDFRKLNRKDVPHESHTD
ncbi:MAG: DUF2232 domain-containing protein [Acidobacteriota bacterium]